MPVLYTEHFVQFFDNNGDPLSNGKLFAYDAGTTTPRATFTTEDGTVQHAHPVVLDSSGRQTIFIDGSYRFDLFDENDVLIRSTDNVTAFENNVVLPASQTWYIVDQKANNVSGGTFTSGVVATRDLNTTIGTNNISGSSLSSNQFTLPAGDYEIFAKAPGYRVAGHSAFLFNFTDGVKVLDGSSAHSPFQTSVEAELIGGYSNSFIEGPFSIADTKTFEIRHTCGQTIASAGLGLAANQSRPEIYTQVKITKVS